jgi:Holliday junction resolvasome RuvABC endonuclease subunit
MGKQRFAIGIDPGVTETGVVLSQEDTRGDLIPVAWATMSCPPGDSQVARVTALAGNVVNLIMCWIEEYEIEAVDIAVELPIFNGNPQALILQIRLLQEIESGIFHIVAGELMECWVTEVNPATSKSLAGCGKREKPVAVSPFADYEARIATKEALADAWAHSLATWGIAKKTTRLAMHDMTSALVVVNDSKPDALPPHAWAGFTGYNLREAL